jgi:tetratricopeptide (TPR) repeat protein
MLTGSRKDYDVNRYYQDEMREMTDRERLAQAAADGESGAPSFNTKKWITIGIVVVLAVVTLFAGFQRAFAQDAVDPGSGEPFHDAMLAYRVGIYLLNKGDYDRAVEKLSEAVEQMPEWAFQVEPGYADMYWTLGEALEGAGRYEDALVNYRAFQRWVGDEAAAWTFAKVDALQAQVDALLYEDTRL